MTPPGLPNRIPQHYTVSFHGFRYSLFRNGFASGCFTLRLAASQSTRTLLRSAILPSRQVEVERKHFSISLMGFSRERTHSRKLAQCRRLPLLSDFWITG